MDQNKLLEIASHVTNMKMFPYFDAAHYVVMCLLVRDDFAVPEHSGKFLSRLCEREVSKHSLWTRSAVMSTKFYGRTTLPSGVG